MTTRKLEEEEIRKTRLVFGIQTIAICLFMTNKQNVFCYIIYFKRLDIRVRNLLRKDKFDDEIGRRNMLIAKIIARLYKT